MAILAALIFGALVGGVVIYLYHDAAIAELKHLKSAAEKERDELKLKYNELVDRLKTK